MKVVSQRSIAVQRGCAPQPRAAEMSSILHWVAQRITLARWSQYTLHFTHSSLHDQYPIFVFVIARPSRRRVVRNGGVILNARDVNREDRRNKNDPRVPTPRNRRSKLLSRGLVLIFSTASSSRNLLNALHRSVLRIASSRPPRVHVPY